MIYVFQENKFCENISELEKDKYQLYKEGCLVNLSKAEQLIRKKILKKPLVAKRKSESAQKQIKQAILQKQEEEMLICDLQVEEREIFLTNRSIIFEEWQKFKYIRPGDSGEDIPESRVQELKQIFTQGGQEVKNLGNEELDYITRNWRLFMKAFVHQNKIAQKSKNGPIS